VLTSPGTWSPGGTASNPPAEPVLPNTGAMKVTTSKKYYQGFATFADAGQALPESRSASRLPALRAWGRQAMSTIDPVVARDSSA
jgi:hypothetical protein